MSPMYETHFKNYAQDPGRDFCEICPHKMNKSQTFKGNNKRKAQSFFFAQLE